MFFFKYSFILKEIKYLDKLSCFALNKGGNLKRLLLSLSSKFIENSAFFYEAKLVDTKAKKKRAFEGSKRLIYLMTFPTTVSIFSLVLW